MFKKLFSRSEPEAELSPYERAKKAIDEVNAALKEMPDHLRHVRVYVQNGDARCRRRSEAMLGYWNNERRGFDIIYGRDVLGNRIDIPEKDL